MASYTFRVDGIEVKLGTARMMRRVGLDEYHSLLASERLKAGSANFDPNAHLARSREYIWRFPWPDESGQAGPEIAKRDQLRSEAIIMAGLHIAHASVTAIVSGKVNRSTLDMLVPCPYSERGSELVPGLVQRAQIVGEAFTSGPRATLFSCEYCGVLFYLTEADLAAVRVQNLDKPAILSSVRATTAPMHWARNPLARRGRGSRAT